MTACLGCLGHSSPRCNGRRCQHVPGGGGGPISPCSGRDCVKSGHPIRGCFPIKYLVCEIASLEHLDQQLQETLGCLRKSRRPCLVANRAILPSKWPSPSRNMADSCNLNRLNQRSSLFLVAEQFVIRFCRDSRGSHPRRCLACEIARLEQPDRQPQGELRRLKNAEGLAS